MPRFICTSTAESALERFFFFFLIFHKFFLSLFMYVYCMVLQNSDHESKIIRKVHLVNLEWTHSHSSASKRPKGCILFHFSSAAVCSFTIFYYRSLVVYLAEFVALFFWLYYLVFFFFFFVRLWWLFNSAMAGAA